MFAIRHKNGNHLTYYGVITEMRDGCWRFSGKGPDGTVFDWICNADFWELVELNPMSPIGLIKVV